MTRCGRRSPLRYVTGRAAGEARRGPGLADERRCSTDASATTHFPRIAGEQQHMHYLFLLQEAVATAGQNYAAAWAQLGAGIGAGLAVIGVGIGIGRLGGQ